jgi:hypothetical protein
MDNLASQLSELSALHLAKLLLKSAERAAARMPVPVRRTCRDALALATRIIDRIKDSDQRKAVEQSADTTDKLMQLFVLHIGERTKSDAKLILAACGYCIWVYANYHDFEKISQTMNMGNDVMEYKASDALDCLADAARRQGNDELDAQSEDFHQLFG